MIDRADQITFVTVRGPIATTAPTSIRSHRSNVRPVNATENPINSGSAARGR